MISTNHVSQHEREAGRVCRDGRPSDSLSIGVCAPDGILGRFDDRCGPRIDGKKEDSRKDGEGTHFLGWRVESGKEGREEGVRVR